MDKNVIIASNWCWDIEMPSQIFPKRLANAFHLCKWNVVGIQGEHEWVPEEKRGIYKAEWGSGCTVPSDQVTSTLDQILEHIPKPDLIIVANTISQDCYDVAKKYDTVIAPFQSDPFYAGYPNKETIEAQFGQADLCFFNEGNPVNYIKNISPEIGEKCHTINHALDLTIAPTDEEVRDAEKKYIASVVAGLEMQRHKQFIRLFYIPTLSFPNHKFAVAGSLDRRFPKHVMNDPKADLTKEEIEKYTDFDFNIEPKSEPLKNPVAGSQVGVLHWNPQTEEYQLWFGGGLSWYNTHRLYMNSFFSFDGFGDYLTKNKYAKGTFGTKIFEQLGSGSAVVTNHIDGIEKLVIDGKTGFIVETTKEAIDAYRHAVDNPEEVIKMGIRARKSILEKHTWNHRVKQIEKIVKRE